MDIQNSKFVVFIITFMILSFLAYGQTEKVLSESDYQRAVSMLRGNTDKLTDSFIRPRWLPDGHIWYRNLRPEKGEYKLFNPATGKFTIAPSRKELFAKASVKEAPQYSRDEVVSPDGKLSVFIKNWNLWQRNLSTGSEKPLTTDGVENFGYATDNAGWTHSDRAIVKWSPDSKRIATFQQDQRQVNNMYLVKPKAGAPELVTWKYPFVGDATVIMIHRVVIDISGEPKVIPLKTAPDFHRSTFQDDISWRGTLADVEWSADSRKIVFVSTSRDHKQARVRMADCRTGDVRDIFEETVDTQYESGQDAGCWRYVSESNEILWYSERSNWGHLYLYDVHTGKLKNQITSGDWVVRSVMHVDPERRMIYFVAGGREKGVNPYFRNLYSVKFNGRKLKRLTPEPGDHVVMLSPDKRYFIDINFQPDVPPVYTVRKLHGKPVAILEKTDISRLLATGWTPPHPFTIKSADGRFDLYGVFYTPSNFDPSRFYPVIDYIYPGPSGGSFSHWEFSTWGDFNALAELGFIVVRLEGSGNPFRSKAFHDSNYGNMAENTLPDQVSALTQLASRYKFFDLSRVGIYGHSGGGFATAAAMFKYPEFFKVGISESGNHDNRAYEDDWGERYIGLERKNAQGVSNYADQANPVYAKNLRGKLLLIYGGMDDNVPPGNTDLVVDALIKANKDFDLLRLPYERHIYSTDRYYVMRRRWDYFVRNLLKATPPHEFRIEIEPDPRINENN